MQRMTVCFSSSLWLVEVKAVQTEFRNEFIYASTRRSNWVAGLALLLAGCELISDPDSQFISRTCVNHHDRQSDISVM